MASLTSLPCGDMVWRDYQKIEAESDILRRWFLWSHILLYQHNYATLCGSMQTGASRATIYFIERDHFATWRSACSPTVQHVFFCFLSFWYLSMDVPATPCESFEGLGAGMILFAWYIWFYSRISCDLELPNWCSCNFPCLSNLHEVFKRVIAGGHGILGKSMAVFHGLQPSGQITNIRFVASSARQESDTIPREKIGVQKFYHWLPCEKTDSKFKYYELWWEDSCHCSL